MRKFKFTHNSGVTSEAESRDLLDAVFTFRGNYQTLSKVEEVEIKPIVLEEKHMTQEEFENMMSAGKGWRNV